MSSNSNSSPITLISDDSFLMHEQNSEFDNLVTKLRQVRKDVEATLDAVEEYFQAVRVMCVKSMECTKQITSFYDETDGRLGSSAIVHLKAIEEPFKKYTVPYVRCLFFSLHGHRNCRILCKETYLFHVFVQASKLQLAGHSARAQYTKIFETFEVLLLAAVLFWFPSSSF